MVQLQLGHVRPLLGARASGTHLPSMAETGGNEGARSRRHRLGPEFLVCAGVVAAAGAVEA